MNRPIRTVWLLLLALAAPVNQYAQVSDQRIELLRKAIEIVGKINSLPLNFQTVSVADGVATEKLSPESMANLKKQAALLNELPAGTTVEVGVHTFKSEATAAGQGGPAAEVALSEKRAELVRRELIKLGVKTRLTAKGYGATMPVDPNPTAGGRLKNQRVEFLIAGLPGSAAAAAAKDFIVAGKGWGRVVIGASSSEVEAVLGKSEVFDNSSPDNFYATYFAKGVVVVYDAAGRVKVVRFIGNAPLYSSGKTKFQSFQGAPDKNLTWGASTAQVIAAYGEPARRESSGDIAELIYPGIKFNFKGDKLTVIAITPAASGT
ncbi:MAG: OmpA family protein [Pyrinomonadaceae bacterium]